MREEEALAAAIGALGRASFLPAAVDYLRSVAPFRGVSLTLLEGRRPPRHIYDNVRAEKRAEVIETFEKEHDIKVTLDGYDSNETMLAKVKPGGSGYDIVVPGDYMIAIMVKEGLLAEVNASEMPNFKNVDPKWVDVYWDPGRTYSVPW